MPTHQTKPTPRVVNHEANVRLIEAYKKQELPWSEVCDRFRRFYGARGLGECFISQRLRGSMHVCNRVW